MGLAAMAVGSVLLRYRSPAIAIAVLFYLVGQSLESSTLALELYFEHRNYLPAMLMFWPLCLWLCGLKPSITSTCQKTPHLVLIAINTSRRSDLVRSTIALLLLVILATMTHMRSSLWGNPTDQALVWAKLNPGSPRAQANAAQTEMGQGRPDLAVTRLRPMLAAVTNDPQITLNLLGAECLLGHIQPSTMESALNSLRTTRDPGSLLSSWFMRAIDQASTHTCPELDLSMLDKLLDAALDNSFLTHIPGRLQDLLSLKGRLALAQGNPGLALQFANQALDKQVRIDLALEQAAHLGATGHPEEGLAHLDHYAQVHSNEYRPKFGMPAIHALVLEHQHYWDNEQIRLQYTLQQDMRSKGPH